MLKWIGLVHNGTYHHAKAVLADNIKKNLFMWHLESMNPKLNVSDKNETVSPHYIANRLDFELMQQDLLFSVIKKIIFARSNAGYGTCYTRPVH